MPRRKFKIGDYVILNIANGFGGAKGIVGQIVPPSEVPPERSDPHDSSQWVRHMMFVGPTECADELIKHAHGYWYFPDPDSWSSVEPIGRP